MSFGERRTKSVMNDAPDRTQYASGNRPIQGPCGASSPFTVEHPGRGRSEDRAMVQIAIDGDTLTLRMRGIDQILALRSELSLPLAHIRAVTIRPGEAHGWFHGLRFGTNLPGVVTAGTFLTGDGLVFWDVHDPDKTIALDIDHEFYKRVIVEVEGSPEAAAAQIETARERSRAGGA